MLGKLCVPKQADIRQCLEGQAVVLSEILLPEPLILLMALEERLGSLATAERRAADNMRHMAEPCLEPSDRRVIDARSDIGPAKEMARDRHRRVPDQDQLRARVRILAQVVGFRLSFDCGKCFPTRE